jgi:hypothetical protein
LDLSDWQPIEAAPKDGTFVLVFADEEVWVAAWDAETSTGAPWGWADARENGVRLKPTHFMPLPLPPSA